jgi:hypothetical protein
MVPIADVSEYETSIQFLRCDKRTAGRCLLVCMGRWRDSGLTPSLSPDRKINGEGRKRLAHTPHIRSQCHYTTRRPNAEKKPRPIVRSVLKTVRIIAIASAAPKGLTHLGLPQREHSN